MRTPRQRTAVAGGALLLLASLAWGLWTILAPKKVDYSNTWFLVEFTTDNQAHPVHLTLPDGKEGMFDILMIENLSDKPLSLLAFSSRPRIQGLPPNQVMTAWAQWIAASRQGIIVQPRSTWVLNPSDLDYLPSFHGHTWIGVFFDGTPPASSGGLPAITLPSSYHGRYRVHFAHSQLSGGQLVSPQLYRMDLITILQQEVDSSNKTALILEARDIKERGITALELR